MDRETFERAKTELAAFGTFIGGCIIVGQDAAGYTSKEYDIRAKGEGYVLVKQIWRDWGNSLTTLGIMGFSDRNAMIGMLQAHRERWYCNALLLTLRSPLTLQPDI